MSDKVITTKTIKENSKYRITQFYNTYFLDGRNKFGRWVIIRSIKQDEIDTVWSKAEQAVR